MLTGPDQPPAEISTTCCIAGGGPAGMMLGLLLARAGTDVTVLEEHADFLRDFRGDTLHPSTLEVMHELGLAERLLALPHQKLEQIKAQVGREEIPFADFTHLPVHHRYIALMPQWDFLSFLAREAATYPDFRLLMNAEAVDLVEAGGRVRGVMVDVVEGRFAVKADLVVAADGRTSRLRERAGLQVESIGAPIDVFWFRVTRTESEPVDTAGQFTAGRVLVRIYRGDYWQCAYVIAKGSADRVRAQGIEAFRDKVQPGFAPGTDLSADLRSWDDVKLLTVTVDRLKRWYKPGFLAIGDAAHAMSPIGGVGINLAVQDAVAAANVLVGPLLAGTVESRHLEVLQRRRMFPTRVTQKAQVLIQDRILQAVLTATADPKVPWPLKLMRRLPLLRRIPARLVGMGVRPEHVDKHAGASVRSG